MLATADEELVMSDLSPSGRWLELWSPNHEKTTKTEAGRFRRPPLVDHFDQKVSAAVLEIAQDQIVGAAAPGNGRKRENLIFFFSYFGVWILLYYNKGFFCELWVLRVISFSKRKLGKHFVRL